MIPLQLRRPRRRPSHFRPFRWRLRRSIRRVLFPTTLLVLLGLWLIDPDTLNSAWERQAPRAPETVDPGGLSVVDGDTVRRAGQTIRLVGYDTPETYRAECEAERTRGDAATARLRELLAQASSAQLSYLPRQDRYVRDLARLTIDGRDVAATMVREGHARSYSGGQRESWCG